MNDALLGALLVIAVAIVFWCLSVVCEERFVPALAVICDVLKIPDDVAGATLMAAGACSPEVVSSFIALFVTHSALGVGSVVGSEIFNHLCILGFLRQGRRPRTGQGHRRAGDGILRPRPGAAALRADARARRG